MLLLGHFLVYSLASVFTQFIQSKLSFSLAVWSRGLFATSVVQSCCENNFLAFVVREKKGASFTGLYRGISSNIASSVPISAIYTFTYESVKTKFDSSFFLRWFCQHRYVVRLHTKRAHKTADAHLSPSQRCRSRCSMFGVSFSCIYPYIYYSTNALLGIIRNGGLRSLYAGWGAVLCRNIPHSIIKFYTYENLKMWMLSPLHSGVPLNTIQTVTHCGGIAGSTAALFTTPFDVVKTRLQTQQSGTASQYNGVLQTLLEIARTEGLKSLYRGLTPRLIMYVSQGSLFFTSYEFFKQLFSLNES
ncbi:hypothetical protein MLD38_018460 [Melastoma candidum]|uniref:Uncharacterized protein n=1 Tax=Melastoma candidum TaxID=119954 RepID=A0ACB9QVT8_9MYRT|nr:hypothetical protein MLD38_018460 [Melastoma candidum]